MRKIFISAWNDSGGTYTARLLDNHPLTVSWPYELQLGTGKLFDLYQKNNWFHDKYRWPSWEGDLDKTDPNLLFAAIEDQELKSTIKAPDSSKHKEFSIYLDEKEWKECFVKLWSKSAKTRSNWIDCYIKSFLKIGQGREPEENFSFLAHCPIFILDAEKIIHDFPNAKIVHIIRPIYNCYADFKKRHPEVSAQDYAKNWNVINMMAVIMAMKYPDHIRLVNYCAILKDSLKALNPILKWAGLELLSKNPIPTWCGNSIDTSDMGPFGGVPNASIEYEKSNHLLLENSDRDVLELMSQATTEHIEYYMRIK